MAHVSDQNFASFVRSMASILERIEHQQAMKTAAPKEPAGSQLELPFVTPQPASGGLITDRKRSDRKWAA